MMKPHYCQARVDRTKDNLLSDKVLIYKSGAAYQADEDTQYSVFISEGWIHP